MNRPILVFTALSTAIIAACAQPGRQTSDKEESAAANDAITQTATPPPPPVPMAQSSEIAYAGDGRLRAATTANAGTIVGAVAKAPMSDVNTENYADTDDNPIHRASEQPVSTFSIDVDTGSYSNVRRMLNQGQLPPIDAVRAEEFINYFDYGYPVPQTREKPFTVTTEIAPAPWNDKRHLLLVGLKGYEVPKSQIPAANVVYLIDSSGSMQSPDKIELLKAGFRAMTEQLRPQDRVAIVAYAGSAGLVLPSTPGSDKAAIVSALDRIQAGGSTNGGAGIELAYAVAQDHFIEGGVNRVVLASDGDFNVGTVSVDALTMLVADKRKSGIGITVLGFGGGNLNDHLAEQLANKGNGNYFYIDTMNEGRKVLVDQLASTVLTIAEDVKVQVEFNPSLVEEYRLIGYENRLLDREDFNNDRVDAGEIGAGHNVTALYEISLKGSGGAASDPLRYRDEAPAASSITGDEIAFVKLRYKNPGETQSRLIERPVQSREVAAVASDRLYFAAAVAGFADALRGGEHLNDWGLSELAGLAQSRTGNDPYRREFIELIDAARGLSDGPDDVQIGQ
jgi:Ca-activated chloride channel family protein